MLLNALSVVKIFVIVMAKVILASDVWVVEHNLPLLGVKTVY